MTELPPITIVMTTYFPDGEEGRVRKLAALQTLQSWKEYLTYDGALFLHVADDGSNREQHTSTDLPSLWFPSGTYSQQHRMGVGSSLNKGFQRGFEKSPLVAYFVDDWSLTDTFDLSPWAELLITRPEYGMVRLGPPHPNIRGSVDIHMDNVWGMRLERYGFAFSHRPAIYHQRMMQTYGWFPEQVNALECERLYNERVNQNLRGPDVAMALPHPWRHIDSIELAYLHPT